MCYTPYTRLNKDAGEYQSFPCGKCPVCLKRRVSGWSFRLRKEGEVWNLSLFVTLTYNTDHVPITPKGYMTLCKKDLQKFFKRLRRYSKKKIKYYAVGEYGGRTNRPHYHIIMFGADYSDILEAWKLEGKAIGEIHFGQVSGASIGYTLKYVMKPGKIPLHQNDDRCKEFQLMSNGLGKNYMTEEMVNWHKRDILNRMYIPIEDGKVIAMPRYYKDKIYDENERAKISVENRIKIIEKTLEEEKKYVSLYGEKGYEKRKVELHLSQFKKMHDDAQTRTKI